MRKPTVIILLIAIVLSNIIMSCSSKPKQYVDKRGAYSCLFFDIPNKDSYDAHFSKAFLDGEKYCVPVAYSRYNAEKNDFEVITDIYTLDEKGKILFTLELQGNQLPTAVFPDEYAFIGFENRDQQNVDLKDVNTVVVFIDKKTGVVTRTVDPGFRAEFIYPVSDGFVLLGQNQVAKYQFAGMTCQFVTTDFLISLEHPFFAEDDRYYVVEESSESELVCHSIDFQSGVCTRIVSTKELGISSFGFFGQYFYRYDGEYKIDMETRQVSKIVDWNTIDIRPNRKKLRNSIDNYAPLDDVRFYKVYEYTDGKIELLLFYWDEKLPCYNKETITIGGSQVFNDKTLRWIVYNFNISNDKYRVVLEDYSRFFAGDSLEELQRAKLSMIQYFKDGNTPDIFYGNSFDYEQMGRMGMVMDLKPLMDENPTIQETLTLPAKKLMVNADNHCYQFFSSYWLNGYVGLAKHFPNGNNIDAFSLNEISQKTGIPSYGGVAGDAGDIVNNSLFYSFPMIWGGYHQEKKLSTSSLEQLIDLAVQNINSRPMSNDSSSNGLADDRFLLSIGAIGSPLAFARKETELQERTVFIGFPSVDGSVHLAETCCCMAISTTAKQPRVCWELMCSLFSYETQRIVVTNEEIPVNQEALDMLVETVKNPQNSKDEIMGSIVYNAQPMPDWIVDDYLDAVNSVDTIATHDRALYKLIHDEVTSYYTQNRSVKQIANSLDQRLDLYAKENFS